MTWMAWAMAHVISGLFTGMVVFFGATGLTAGVNKVVDSRAQFVSMEIEIDDSSLAPYTIVVSADEPEEILPNQVYLVGDWKNEGEFVKNSSAPSVIIFRYSGKSSVCLLAGSEPGLIRNQHKVLVLKVFRDGAPLRGRDMGSDVIGINDDSLVLVQGYNKYVLVDGAKDDKEHVLRIVVEKPGLLAQVIGFNGQCE